MRITKSKHYVEIIGMIPAAHLNPYLSTCEIHKHSGIPQVLRSPVIAALKEIISQRETLEQAIIPKNVKFQGSIPLTGQHKSEIAGPVTRFLNEVEKLPLTRASIRRIAVHPSVHTCKIFSQSP